MLDYNEGNLADMDLVEIDTYVEKLSLQKIVDLMRHLYSLQEFATERHGELILMSDIIASTPDNKYLTYCKDQITCEDASFFLHGYSHAMERASKATVAEHHPN